MTRKKVHDAVFRQFFGDIAVARDFLQIYLPEKVLARVDMGSLAITPGSFVEPNLKQYCSDILYSLKMKDGRDCYIYALIEHQSSPDKLIGYRMLRYGLAVMQQHLDQGHEQLPLVLPLLFYNGETTPYPHTTCWLDCFEDRKLAEEIYMNPFPLVDVTVMSDEEILTNRRVALLQLVQKHIRARDMLAIVGFIAQLLREFPVSHEQFKSLLYYISERGEISDEQKFLETIVQDVPGYREDVMTIQQVLEQKGIQKGLQQGLQQTAQKMLKNGFSLAQIKEITGLSRKDFSSLH